MKKFQVVYMPIGVPTFDLIKAKEEFEKSVKLLKELEGDTIYPDEMLLNMDLLNKYIDKVNPDLIIVQNITFANGEYISQILKKISCPVVLWTLREDIEVGNRLKLNSLTGAYSAGNVLNSLRKGNFEYIFGSPEEDNVRERISKVIKACKLKKDLEQLNLAAIGHTPQGFGFGRALDIDMLNVFGVSLESIEARELINRAKSFSEDECKEYLDDTNKVTIGFDNIPKENKVNFARLYKAYKEYVDNNNIGAVASRCWPDFFTDFGTPVCAILSRLNDSGIAASCEADAYGALSMYIGMKLTDKAVFFGDPVSLNEAENTITFWHCGMAPSSLANTKTGATIGVHPNRKIGPVMDFGCKACSEVTIFRIGRNNEGKFRFFLAKGEALDKEKQFIGTSIVVKTENNSKDVVERSINDGWEPHFVVVYGNVISEIEILGKMLEIEMYRY